MSETIRVAFAGLTANKLRTGLTILGLMIGVGSVIVLISVGTGSSNAVEKQIDALGSNVLLVTSTPTLGGLRRSAPTSNTQLSLSDANALGNRFQAPDVQSVSPVVTAGQVTLAYQGTTYTPSSFVGTTSSYQQARSYTMADGSWFSGADEQQHNRVLVLGPTVADGAVPGAGPRRPDGGGQRHKLPGHRCHRAEGLQREPEPG